MMSQIRLIGMFRYLIESLDDVGVLNFIAKFSEISLLNEDDFFVILYLLIIIIIIFLLAWSGRICSIYLSSIFWQFMKEIDISARFIQSTY